MSTDGLLVLILVLVSILVVVGVLAAAGVWIVALRWRRSRQPGRGLRRRPARRESASDATPAAAQSPQAGSAKGAPVPAHPPAGPTPRGDVPADDERILALELEDPVSTEAVFRNIDKIKPLLRAEAAESDRIGRVTPLAGRALRAAGVFRWGFPQERGGLGVSFADQLEAVSQLSRIDMGMGWVTTWLTAHGDMAGRLDAESFAEIYPSVDLPTVCSATPLARAVEVPGDKYRIEQAKWRLGSGGFHADRWLAAATVWDEAGEPVICHITGEHKMIALWLPTDKVQQDDDWDPMGVRSSGSASYHLNEPIEVPRGWSFNLGADRRPRYFAFMGVMVGAAQHLLDITLTTLRAKQEKGTSLGAHDMNRLTQAMASLDMMVLGLRGYAQYIDEITRVRPSGAPTVAESAWLESVGMPVRQTIREICDITADIYGTGYVAAGSEFGRVLRDVQVALAHWWFRLSDTQEDRGNRVKLMLESPATAAVWDAGWPVKVPAES